MIASSLDEHSVPLIVIQVFTSIEYLENIIIDSFFANIIYAE